MLPRAYYLMAVLILAFVGAASAHPSKADREVQEGDKFFRAFQVEKALEHYQKAATLDPNNFDARLKFLRVNNSIGQNLRDVGADRKLAEYYFRQNLGISEKLYRDFPKRAEAAFSVAVAYGNLALYSSAKEKVRLSRDIEKNLKHAVELDPKFPYSYLGLGIFYREVAQLTFMERFFARLFFGEIPQGTLEDSIGQFRIAVEKDPNFIFTHYQYAKALLDADNIPDAVREYQLVIRLPATDSGDAFLKAMSKKALVEIQDDYPSISMDQQGSAAP